MCWTACYRKKHWEHLWSPRHSTAPISISVRNVLASVMHTRFLSIVFLICDYCCWQWEVECSSLSLYACPGLEHIAVCMTSLHAPWCWACLLAVNRLLFTGWRSLWFFCPQPHCPWSARSMFPVLQWLVCKCEQHTSIVNSFFVSLIFARCPTRYSHQSRKSSSGWLPPVQNLTSAFEHWVKYTYQRTGTVGAEPLPLCCSSRSRKYEAGWGFAVWYQCLERHFTALTLLIGWQQGHRTFENK